MTTRVFAVDGMSCGHCVKAITDEVSSVPGVSAVQVDLAGRTVLPGLIDCHAHFAHWGMNLAAHQDQSLMREKLSFRDGCT